MMMMMMVIRLITYRSFWFMSCYCCCGFNDVPNFHYIVDFLRDKFIDKCKEAKWPGKQPKQSSKEKKIKYIELNA